MRWFTLILALLFCVVADAAVYRYIDENGNVAFSDEPVDGGVRVEVSPAPAIDLKDLPPLGTEPKADSRRSAAKAAPTYEHIDLKSPRDDQAVRANGGNVSLEVDLKPALRTDLGHRFAVKLDGRRLDRTWSENPQLTAVDRGTHQLQVMVVDASGEPLIKTDTITFHVLRRSILLGP